LRLVVAINESCECDRYADSAPMRCMLTCYLFDLSLAFGASSTKQR
jgi:hypothetical protein